jgi:hypothetical protein
MPDMEHNVFCNFEVAESLTQLIDNLPSTTCVSVRREVALAQFRAFLDWYLEGQSSEASSECLECPM